MKKIFQISSIIILIGLIPTLFIVYMDINTKITIYYIIGYVIFMLIYLLVSIVLGLYFVTKLNKKQLLGVMKDFFIYFIVISMLYALGSIVFHSSFGANELYMILGSSLGIIILGMISKVLNTGKK